MGGGGGGGGGGRGNFSCNPVCFFAQDSPSEMEVYPGRREK